MSENQPDPFSETQFHAVREGIRSAVPVVVSAFPFAILFGAIGVDNGLSVFEVTAMSALVYGGASQMVGIELFGHHIAPWLIVLSIFAVNFRHVLYSAATGRRIGNWSLPKQAIAFFFLTDPQFAETERHGDAGRLTFRWYMTMAAMVYVSWVVGSAAGAIFGKLITDPHALGLDILLPIYFLGLVMGFRKRPLWLPLVIVSGIASILAYKFVGTPWHVSIGAVAGMVMAAILAPAKPQLAGDEHP